MINVDIKESKCEAYRLQKIVEGESIVPFSLLSEATEWPQRNIPSTSESLQAIGHHTNSIVEQGSFRLNENKNKIIDK